MNIFNLFGKRINFADGLIQAGKTENMVLLDVRTPQEYKGGHIPDSENFPLERIQEIEIDKSRPLFVYCYSGVRSRWACPWLNAQGYQASNFGGISGYRGTIK